jgi:hypothetical protein
MPVPRRILNLFRDNTVFKGRHLLYWEPVSGLVQPINIGAAGTVLTGANSGPPSFVAPSAVNLTGRLKASGSSLAAPNFALSAGWGSTATLSAISGTDQAWQVTITANGSGLAANPTLTLTFKDGAWPAVPQAIVRRNGGDQLSVPYTWTVTATQLTITLAGTPQAGETFTFSAMLLG